MYVKNLTVGEKLEEYKPVRLFYQYDNPVVSIVFNCIKTSKGLDNHQIAEMAGSTIVQRIAQTVQAELFGRELRDVRIRQDPSLRG